MVFVDGWADVGGVFCGWADAGGVFMIIAGVLGDGGGGSLILAASFFIAQDFMRLCKMTPIVITKMMAVIVPLHIQKNL